MNAKQFIEQNNITFQEKWVEENPRPILLADNWSKGTNHYIITLSMNGKDFGFYYSMGSHKDAPELDQMIECLARECREIDQVDNYDNWAAEYGYDVDSRKAYALYDEIKKQYTELESFFGDKFNDFLLIEGE